VNAHNPRCLAIEAAAKTNELIRRICVDAGPGGTTRRSGGPCAAAWHFMIGRVLTVHASSLGSGVAACNAEPDRLNTADCEELNLGSWAAEAKRIFPI